MDNEAKMIEILLQIRQDIFGLKQEINRIKLMQETEVLPKVRYLLEAHKNSR